MDKIPPETSALPLGQHFSENLRAILAVAGKRRSDESSGPMTATQIQQKTGIARSTLRALKTPRGDSAANPDLDTLDRLGEALGVPPAFLLMRPQDWSALANAIGDLNDYLAAAAQLQGNGQLDFGSPIEKVLVECKVHPDNRPIGGHSSSEGERLRARDEWRRRACLKMNALMLRPVRAANPRIALAAVASALVSRSTPNDPQIDK